MLSVETGKAVLVSDEIILMSYTCIWRHTLSQTEMTSGDAFTFLL